MRYQEIVEAQPDKPLTPERSRRRAERQQKATAKLADARAAAEKKINAAKRAIIEL